MNKMLLQSTILSVIFFVLPLVSEAAAADLSGAWKVDTATTISPLCGIVQVGSNLTGSCVGPTATGAITGSISGQSINWRWQVVGFTGKNSEPMDFSATLMPNGTVQGTLVRSGLRPTQFTAVKLSQTKFLAIQQ